MSTTHDAATLTPLEKRRITRACTRILRQWRHLDGRPDHPIYLLAEGSVGVRNYPAMRIAVALWEEMPAAWRAKEASDAKAAWEAHLLAERKKDALKEPYLFPFWQWDHPRTPPTVGHLHRRFAALRIAVFCGAPPSCRLHRLIYDALVAHTDEAYALPLIAWDALPEEERATIMGVARMRLDRAKGGIKEAYDREYDERWWVDALAHTNDVPRMAPVGGISEREKAQLRARFGQMRREEYAAD